VPFKDQKKQRASAKKYQDKHKPETAARKKKWREENREKYLAYSKKYNKEHREEQAERYRKNRKAICRQHHEYYVEHRDALIVRSINYTVQKREAIITALGGKCCRCSFSDIRALQVDHVNGDGYKERRKYGNGYKNYKRILEQVLSGSKDYQVLCANCNQIKKIENNETTKGRHKS
jgi:hypothetical protein